MLSAVLCPELRAVSDAAGCEFPLGSSTLGESVQTSARRTGLHTYLQVQTGPGVWGPGPACAQGRPPSEMP